MAEPSPTASGNIPSASQPTLAADPLVTCVSLDFSCKEHKRITVDDVQPAMYAAKFVWIDVDIAQTDDADLGLWCGPNHVNLKRGKESLGAFPYDEILGRLRHELDALIAQQETANA